MICAKALSTFRSHSIEFDIFVDANIILLTKSHVVTSIPMNGIFWPYITLPNLPNIMKDPA